MKFSILLFIIFFLVSTARGADTKDSVLSCNIKYDTLTMTDVYLEVDRMPKVDGGMQVLFQLFSANIKVASNANQLQSKNIIGFIIDKNGNIRGKRILKEIENSGVGSQALRIIDDVKWIPGECNGEKVDVLLILPFYIDFER